MTGRDKYLTGGSKEDRARFCEVGPTLEQVTQRGCGVSLLGDIQDPILTLSNCFS